MKLLEHEAKVVLQAAAVPVPSGTLVMPTTPPSLSFPVVLKSQVPTGGRGKLGGVVIVDSPETLDETAARLFDMEIKGYKPRVLLAEEKLDIAREHYLSLLIDRASASIRLIAHKEGGVEVESNDSTDFLNIPINETLLEDAAGLLADYFAYDAGLVHPLLEKLFRTFVDNDATLLEINPLVLTADNRLVCGDCKLELDDAARFRHDTWNFEDTPQDTNFVTLNPKGSVATIANGAGLAMATVDAVARSGLTPANFLDIGGGANTESVLKAFRRIVEFPSVTAIVINIFAGITRCDEVAKAIIEARKQIEDLPPLFIRLAGTNFEDAVALLSEEKIPTLATLEECLSAAKEVAHA